MNYNYCDKQIDIEFNSNAISGIESESGESSGIRTRYKNAKNLFPEWLLKALQEYAQGEIIYVPRKEPVRAGWGAANGTREKYEKRNREIISLAKGGAGIEQLAKLYYLSEYSIKKILSKK